MLHQQPFWVKIEQSVCRFSGKVHVCLHVRRVEHSAGMQRSFLLLTFDLRVFC